MLDLLKDRVETFQDFTILAGRAFANIFRRPHYGTDIILQMESIGVGSLPIVVLIGLFSGIIMGQQMSRALVTYGAQGKIGEISKKNYCLMALRIGRSNLPAEY